MVRIRETPEGGSFNRSSLSALFLFFSPSAELNLQPRFLFFLISTAPLGIPKTMTWEQYDDYLGTASGLHEYARLNGEEAGKKLRREFLDAVKEGVKKEGGRDDGKIDVVWPAVVMLAGKKL